MTNCTDTCSQCGQAPDGQSGEYPCTACGLPVLHDTQSVPDDDLPEVWTHMVPYKDHMIWIHPNGLEGAVVVPGWSRVTP